MSDDEEIVKEFLVESYENLDRLDRDLVILEKDPVNRVTLGSIFRTIHTIKGTSGFLAFNQLERLTHVGEDLLARLRDGLLNLTPEITTALLAMVDAVRQMLKNIEATAMEGDRDDRELIAALTHFLTPRENIGPTLVQVGSSPDAGNRAVIPDNAVSSPPPDKFRIELCEDEELAHGLDAPSAEQPCERTTTQVDHPDRLAVQQLPRGPGASDSTIRVDVGLLDRLMNRVGELVLLRNQIVQYTNSTEDNQLLGPSQRLNLLTTELQESVMKTRMQPIGNIWSKFPRTVRDVALACAKLVCVEMEGNDTELDKTIIEAIKDPLTHLVRNAVDHGIETPEVRRAVGKPVEGRLCLRAFHEGGQVNIEITDDGAGLDLERIRNKAVQKGLISAEQMLRMSESEICNLIFLPGFSTAEKVTNVSGRGVGMDVVKTNIGKIGGTVDLQSKAGQGSTVRMKIPLTLAIIPALIVSSAGDRYAIPQVSLLELVRLEGEQVGKGIESVNGSPVHRLRGRLLPLLYLNRELKTELDAPEYRLEDPIQPKAIESENVNIVVLCADDRQFGLVVDEINDTEEIVVKPLSKQLKSINTYAGATIMGDGNVALILDVIGLAQRAKVIGDTHNRLEGLEKIANAGNGGQSRTVLLFQHGETGRMAIDLSLVARLEEFSRDSVEVSGHREVVQYRGQIMPLIRVSEALGSHRHSEGESLQVVVYGDQGRSVGLVVDRILDIVEETYVVRPHSGRAGVVGSAIIQHKVTDILDAPGLIAAIAQ
ncbi:MAG TPA: chemotaxis protein CheA [Candidatus Sulfotelmatobacter sp.]|nr:chemotaxis protein CheA [Candidatus Sulfotelmatobacter sp.]